MKRKDFLKLVPPALASVGAMKLSSLSQTFQHMEETTKMPILFLGHGSPMNAIEENEFVTGFRNVAKDLPKPKAILCISAHWETRGTFVASTPSPETIYDFGGFPEALYKVKYPAPGSPSLAAEIKNMITNPPILLDDHWGLDHGAWSVIKHLYPKADVPVLQMSLIYQQGPQYHYELAKQLSMLRRKGILIIGSGNTIHNLGLVAFDKMNVSGYAYDWAIEARTKMNQFIMDNNHEALINYSQQGRPFQLSIPSPEHYLPLLYVLGLKEKNEKITIFNDKAVAGSLAMTSLKIG